MPSAPASPLTPAPGQGSPHGAPASEARSNFRALILSSVPARRHSFSRSKENSVAEGTITALPAHRLCLHFFHDTLDEMTHTYGSRAYAFSLLQHHALPAPRHNYILATLMQRVVACLNTLSLFLSQVYLLPPRTTDLSICLSVSPSFSVCTRKIDRKVTCGDVEKEQRKSDELAKCSRTYAYASTYIFSSLFGRTLILIHSVMRHT